MRPCFSSDLIRILNPISAVHFRVDIVMVVMLFVMVEIAEAVVVMVVMVVIVVIVVMVDIVVMVVMVDIVEIVDLVDIQEEPPRLYPRRYRAKEIRNQGCVCFWAYP